MKLKPDEILFSLKWSLIGVVLFVGGGNMHYLEEINKKLGKLLKQYKNEDDITGDSFDL